MTEPAPCVSIGLPVYNGEATLAAALDSVLAQTFTDFELLINDNASTDRTRQICEAYAARDPRIRYERNPGNLGAAGNFNRVFERARGRCFKWFAADDLLATDYLERCVAALDAAGDDVVLAFPGRRMLSPDGEPLDRDPYLVTGRPDDERDYDDISFPQLMRVCGSRCPIFVFGLMRTDAARRTRGMGKFIAADLVYVAELRLVGRFRQVPGDLFFQRLHPPTPDVIDRTRRAGDAAWFDPRKRKTLAMPEARLLVEMIRAIHRADLGLLDKGRCYASLGSHVATRAHRWSVLRARGARRAAWSLWSRVTLAGIRAARVTSLPLRFWMIAAGLRRGRGKLLRQAPAGPWLRPNPALMEFAAQRLNQRRDLASADLLADWLADACPVRRAAAARTVGCDPERYAEPVRLRLRGSDSAALDRAVTAIADACGAETADQWRRALGDAVCPHPARRAAGAAGNDVCPVGSS